MDTKTKLSSITIQLHWIVAIFMIGLTTLGLYMENAGDESLFDIHISLGVLIIVFVLPRVIVRIKNGWPQAAGNYTKIEHLSGKIMHWVLMLSTVIMPLSGIMMAVAGGHGLHFFGLELVAENISALNLEEPAPLSPMLANLGSSLHNLGGTILPIAIGLHVLGAIKHHIIDKDETLRRMFGQRPR